jgi:hypothetical protein
MMSTSFISFLPYLKLLSLLQDMTNSRVVDDQGKVTNYYGVVKEILDYKFLGINNLKWCSSIVIGLLPVVEHEKINMVGWKLNTKTKYMVMTL